MTLTPHLPAPYLIADDQGVELLNSAGAPYGDWMDWLQDGGEMLSWMVAAGFLTADQAESLAAQLPPAELNRAAADLRALREAFRAALPAGNDVLIADLNRLMARGQGHHRLIPGPDGLTLTHVPRLTSADDLLALVATAVARLLTQGEPGRTRQCDGPTCTYWFRDISKNNRRRWCSMAVCGNRAKAAGHRARQKGVR